MTEKVYAQPLKLDDIVLSPEGLEEMVKSAHTYVVTLTQGGKYRVYQECKGALQPITVADTYEAAQRNIGVGMILSGGLIVNPDKTLDSVMSALSKPDAPNT